MIAARLLLETLVNSSLSCRNQVDTSNKPIAQKPVKATMTQNTDRRYEVVRQRHADMMYYVRSCHLCLEDIEDQADKKSTNRSNKEM